MYEQKEIQLPLSDHPLMTYTDEAALLSVLYSDKRTLPWVYSNFINICSFVASPDYFMAFIYPNYGKPMLECCPECIEYSKIGRDVVSKSWHSVVDMLLDFIQLGYYTYLYCDSYYLSQLEVSSHFMHPTFVSGYDIDKQIFYLSDFKSGQYVYRTAPFQEMVDAYKNTILTKEWQTNSIRFFKLKKDINYTINKDLMILLFTDFLESKNSYGLFEKADYLCYGLNVYRSCIEFMNNKLTNPGYTDCRFVALFLKRAELMLERLNYLVNVSGMHMLQKAVQLFEEVRQSLNVAKNLVIKSNELKDFDDPNSYIKCINSALTRFSGALANEKSAAEIILNELAG